MFKKIFTVMFCFVLLLGVSTLAFAKKAKTKETVKAAEAEETPVVRHRAEPKDPLKDKISVALDVLNQQASMRFWATNHLGIDLTAGFNFVGTTNATYGFKIGGGLVFPMLETEHLNINITPGLSIGLSEDAAQNSYFTFLAKAGVEFESFIVKDVFSVGSSVGVGLGVQSVTPNGGSGNASFVFGLADSFTVMPVILRYYI
jgi:hypothetical protein